MRIWSIMISQCEKDQKMINLSLSVQKNWAKLMKINQNIARAFCMNFGIYKLLKEESIFIT